MEKACTKTLVKDLDVIPCSVLMNRDQWENLEQNIAATLKGYRLSVNSLKE